jgi:hypothetical protein
MDFVPSFFRARHGQQSLSCSMAWIPEPSDRDVATRLAQHEMLYGYVPAIVAGFLLTAIPKWTSRLPAGRRGLSADDDNRVDNRRIFEDFQQADSSSIECPAAISSLGDRPRPGPPFFGVCRPHGLRDRQGLQGTRHQRGDGALRTYLSSELRALRHLQRKNLRGLHVVVSERGGRVPQVATLTYDSEITHLYVPLHQRRCTAPMARWLGRVAGSRQPICYTFQIGGRNCQTGTSILPFLNDRIAHAA